MLRGEAFSGESGCAKDKLTTTIAVGTVPTSLKAILYKIRKVGTWTVMQFQSTLKRANPVVQVLLPVVILSVGRNLRSACAARLDLAMAGLSQQRSLGSAQ